MSIDTTTLKFFDDVTDTMTAAIYSNVVPRPGEEFACSCKITKKRISGVVLRVRYFFLRTEDCDGEIFNSTYVHITYRSTTSEENLDEF